MLFRYGNYKPIELPKSKIRLNLVVYRNNVYMVQASLHLLFTGYLQGFSEDEKDPLLLFLRFTEYLGDIYKVLCRPPFAIYRLFRGFLRS